MILNALHNIYANFERQKPTQLTYKQIKQNDQSFDKFYARFRLYNRTLVYLDDRLMLNIKDKINIQLRKTLINRVQKFEFLKNMKM